MRITISKEEIKLVEYEYEVPRELGAKVESLLEEGRYAEVESLVRAYNIDKTDIDCYSETITDITCGDNTYIVENID